MAALQAQLIDQERQLAEERHNHQAQLAVARQQQHQHQQQQYAAAAPAAAQAVQQTHSITPVKPDVFKNAADCSPSTWLYMMDTFFAAVSYGDAQSVLFAAAHLRDAGMVWWQALGQSLQAPSTWVAFKAAFLLEFQPAEASDVARLKIYQMRQTGSVSEYCKEFRSQLYLVQNMAKEDMLAHFLIGLGARMQDKVRALSPTSVEQAMTISNKLEANAQQILSSRPMHVVPRHQQPQHQPQRHQRDVVKKPHLQQQQQQHSSPMDLSHLHNVYYSQQEDEQDYYSDEDGEEASIAAAAAQRSASWRSNGENSGGRSGSKRGARHYSEFTLEQKKLYDDDKCFSCKEKGHKSRECPKRNLSKNK